MNNLSRRQWRRQVKPNCQPIGFTKLNWKTQFKTKPCCIIHYLHRTLHCIVMHGVYHKSVDTERYRKRRIAADNGSSKRKRVSVHKLTKTCLISLQPCEVAFRFREDSLVFWLIDNVWSNIFYWSIWLADWLVWLIDAKRRSLYCSVDAPAILLKNWRTAHDFAVLVVTELLDRLSSFSPRIILLSDLWLTSGALLCWRWRIFLGRRSSTLHWRS